MKLLAVGDGKYVNRDRITYIHAVRKNKVIIQFQNEVSGGGIGIPTSYLEIKGAEAERLIQWFNLKHRVVSSMSQSWPGGISIFVFRIGD